MQEHTEFEFDAVVLGNSTALGAESPTAANSANEGSAGTTGDSHNEDGGESPEEPKYATDRTAEIDIDDQSGDGTTLRIDEVELGAKAAHLAFFDESGALLGSALVTPQSQPVSVKLIKAITFSQEIDAFLFLDDGDGVFELEDDRPIHDEDGELVDEDFDYWLESDD